MHPLSSFFENATNWGDIYCEFLKKNVEKDRSAGKLFENFCKYYYLCEPSIKSEYENVWLFDEIPCDVKSKLNLGKIDHGIDLVLEGCDGSYSVVQCKFRNDQNAKLSWTKDSLANLFAEGDKADYFIVFTNASGLDKHSLTKKENQLKMVTIGDLVNISSSTINEIKNLSAGIPKAPVKIKQPRDYQQTAIQSVVNGFDALDRGQLILPCGAGKTLVSLWIKESLKPKHTLVLVPSLALLRQIKNEWAINTERFIPYICVCSEKDINKDKDSTVVHAYELGGKVSTNSSEIKSFLNSHNETIVFSTYQSLEAICDAVQNSDFKFDLAICDEAHKTSGSKKGKFGLIHSDANITVKKRLYMTATPRVMSDSLKNELNSDVIDYVCDMDNPSIFGTVFYRMSFKEAIEKGILVDYQIVAIGIDDQELEEAIRQRRFTSDDESIDEIANNYALEKFMLKHSATHAITFHSSVKKAKAFQERHQSIYPELLTYHVNGDQTTNDRNIKMKEFANSSKAIITNARCLTEGVDVPAIDVVYFCDPKNSKIDIVQATGRALRRADHKGKQFGYVVVPIYHREKESLEETIGAGPFKNLTGVIRALCSHDERLVDEIREIKIGKGKGESLIKNISINYSCDLITLDGFHEKLRSNLFDQIVNKIKIPWREFEEAKKFVRSLNVTSHLKWIEYYKNGKKPQDIPTSPEKIYKDKGWVSWSDWLGTKNKSPKDHEFLSFEAAKKIVQKLNLKSESEWRTYSKSGNKPEHIPSNPNVIYKNSGWISWPDWLGTKNKGKNDWAYLQFQKAREFAHTLKIKNAAEWRAYCKSGNKPEDIPSQPHVVYKAQGWDSWGDWLDTKNISAKKKKFSRSRKFLSLEEAKKFSRNLKLKSETEWRNYSKSENKPDNIPSNPNNTYKNTGWISWGDWLGTGRNRNQGRQYRSFLEARKFIRDLKLQNSKQWKEFCKGENRPADIPAKPYVIYKDHGWISLADWLGTKNKKGSDWVFLPFEDARKIVRSLNLKNRNEWSQYCKSGKKPEDIPFAPQSTYKNKGWISVANWLGIDKKNT